LCILPRFASYFFGFVEGSMQTIDDDFPYTSDDPSLAPIEDKNAILTLTPQQIGDLKGTLRLAVGSALVGKDAYVKRLRQMQVTQSAIVAKNIVIDENETNRDRLRYLLLGALFETPDLLQRGLTTAELISSKAIGLFSKLLSPVTKSWAFGPVREQYDTATARGEKVVERLIMKGRYEEQNSRLLIQQKTIDDLVNDILEYILLKTELQEMIQETGVGVATGVTDDFREQSATVDTLLEQKIKSIFKRRAPSETVNPPSAPIDKG
jgi:hypothetical protein